MFMGLLTHNNTTFSEQLFRLESPDEAEKFPARPPAPIPEKTQTTSLSKPRMKRNQHPQKLAMENRFLAENCVKLFLCQTPMKLLLFRGVGSASVCEPHQWMKGL
jgi:hypothetical protein